MSVRSEILAAIDQVVAGRVDQSFTAAEVINAMRRGATRYTDQTIRTHIASRMCSNAPDHHAVVYQDLIRTERGRYRLASTGGTPSPAATPAAEVQVGGGRTATKTYAPAPPLDPAQLSLVVEALTSRSLTETVAATEVSLVGLTKDEVELALHGGVLSAPSAAAAMAVRESLGRINDLIHASVICAVLPSILEVGERIVVAPSLASGNDPTRLHDLQTDRRIAEFKVAIWQRQSANVMRKRTLFADLVALAMNGSPVRKQLYVVGDAPAAFLQSSGADAHRLLQRAHQNLRDRFTAAFGAGPLTVSAFTHGPGADVEIIDLLSILPELRRTTSETDQ